MLVSRAGGFDMSYRALTLVAVLVAMVAPGALAEGKGNWRLQLSTQMGVASGSVDRDGDVLVSTTVEYELPATPHITLGIRLLPVFYYGQDEQDRGRLRDGDFDIDFDDFKLSFGRERGGDTVFGAGVGLGARVYTKAETHTGFFLEAGVNALGHSGRFNGNSSNINFMSGAAIGYQLAGGFNASLRFDHISNAGLGDDNSGSNVLGLGLGFRF